MAEGQSTVTVEGRALTISRVFDLPRDLMFRVLTEPKHITQWMFADGWETPFAETDLRPGGMFRIGMRPADHSEEGFTFEGTYREVAPPDRVVMLLADGRLMTQTLEDLGGGKTRYTLSVEMAESEEQERAGYTQILDNFAAHVETVKAP